MSQVEVYHKRIVPLYYISIAKFYNYLARNKKKELADCERQSEEINSKVYNLVVDQGMTIKQAAEILGISRIKLSKIVFDCQFKEKRYLKRKEEALLVRKSKEDRQIKRLQMIVDIQNIKQDN